jgi:hypothetical protein
MDRGGALANKVAVILTNYNMPERADALREYVAMHTEWPLDFILVDNGSDLAEPSQYTSLRLEENIQTTGGWLMGLEYSDFLARKNKESYMAYWLMITSAEFVEKSLDPLTPLANVLVGDPNAVAVHAALTEDSTSAFANMMTRGGSEPRRTIQMDNIAALWRADFLNKIERFDPSLTYAWGITSETCWKARRDGRSLWIHEGIRVKKVSQIGYTMNRMNMTEQERHDNASAEAQKVLTERYGEKPYRKLGREYAEEGWK